MHRKIVLKYYPDAVCNLRSFGKKYYEIYSQNTFLGSGKSKLMAWKSAYKNIIN